MILILFHRFARFFSSLLRLFSGTGLFQSRFGIPNAHFLTDAKTWPNACAMFAPAGKRMLWRAGRGFVVRDLPDNLECADMSALWSDATCRVEGK